MQVSKRKGLQKNLELVFRCYDVDITDPRYNTKRGAPTVFVPQENECHCSKMCDDQADLALHVTNDHPANSVWACFSVHILPPKGITCGKM